MSVSYSSRNVHLPLLLGDSSIPEHSGLTFTFTKQLHHPFNVASLASTGHKQRSKRASKYRRFASITSGFGNPSGGHGESIRTTFNKIDKDRKGHITEADLQQYAEAHSLPKTYVRPFMDAILQQQQQQQQYRSPDINGSSEGSEQEAEVSYAAFKAFVLSREEGLRDAFRQFDLDRDGHISPDDLHVSLSRVAICSRANRCVFRTRHEVVEELLAKLNIEDLQPLSFEQFRSYFMLLPQQEQLVEYWLSGPTALECADMGGRLTLLERHRHRGSPWGHLLAGAVAGAASRTVTAPLETLRLAAMAGTLPANVDLIAAGRQLVAAGGVAALYRGNLVNVLRSAPARAVDFFAFDLFKHWLGSETYAKTFAAAGLAGTFSWALLYPLEVVRSRLTLDVLHRYKGLGDCVNRMARQEGPRVFYRGLAPSVAAIAPEAAITYGLHDLLKRAYHRKFHQEPDIAASLWCGVLAAWSGQLVAFPLETVSRRMQLAGAAGVAAAAAAAAPGLPAAAAAAGGGGGVAASAAAAAPHMGQVMSSIMREGGIAALYRGLGAATLRLVPSAIVSFGAYELIRKILLDWEVQQEVAHCRAKHKQLHKVLSTAQRCNQHVQQLQEQGIEVPAVGPLCSSSSDCISSSSSDVQQQLLLPCVVCDGQQEKLAKAAAVTAPSTGCQMLAAAAAAADADTAVPAGATAADLAANTAAVDGCPAIPTASITATVATSGSGCKG